MNEKKVPGIRFKGFEDDWEQRKLSDVVGTTYGGGTPATYNDAFWNGDIPWIQTSNTVEDQLFDIEVNKCISNDGLNHSAAQMIPGNSVAVVTHVGVGKLVFMPYSYTTSQDFISLSNLKCNPKFLCYALYRKLREDLHIVQGSAIKGITKEDLMTKQFAMPEIEEQGQIASTLELLDDLITLHQRKLEKLKIVKKSMLENCFPKNGEKVPKFRFAGFTDDWEQRKLSDVVDVCSGMDYKHLSVGNIPVYGTGGYMLSVNKALSYDRDAIGIGRKGTIDKPYILKAPFWTVDTLFYAIPKDKKNIDFVFDLFQRINWKSKDESTGVPSLSKIAINETTVMVPSQTEQEKIGSYFHSLDNLITLHQRKLDKLNKIKKSMLKSMFV